MMRLDMSGSAKLDPSPDPQGRVANREFNRRRTQTVLVFCPPERNRGRQLQLNACITNGAKF
jgi:hypothetical protein